jgi:ABC-type multidrug transport system fused ATPase/permease subunit
MIGIRISSAIRLHYLTALLGQSIHVLDSMPPGYATTTITSTSNVLQLGISEKLGVFFEYNATIVASIIIAFTRNWALTLVTSSTILFIGLSVSVLMPIIVKGHGRVSQVSNALVHGCIAVKMDTHIFARPKRNPLPLRVRPLLVFA